MGRVYRTRPGLGWYTDNTEHAKARHPHLDNLGYDVTLTPGGAAPTRNLTNQD